MAQMKRSDRGSPNGLKRRAEKEQKIEMSSDVWLLLIREENITLQANAFVDNCLSSRVKTAWRLESASQSIDSCRTPKEREMCNSDQIATDAEKAKRHGDHGHCGGSRYGKRVLLGPELIPFAGAGPTPMWSFHW